MMICHVPTIYRYRPIYEYKSEIRQCHHTASSIKSPPRPSSRNDFQPCLAIYSKGAFFTPCCKITATRHNIANAISADIAPHYLMPFDATNPALFDALRSDTIGKDYSTPANPAGHNQTNQAGREQGRIKLHRTGTGTQRNLFAKGERPPAPSPSCTQTGATPKSRYSSLSRESSFLSTQTPKIPCQYLDVTILCFCVGLSLTITVL